jgi:hypothetical protein
VLAPLESGERGRGDLSVYSEDFERNACAKPAEAMLSEWRKTPKVLLLSHETCSAGLAVSENPKVPTIENR